MTYPPETGSRLAVWRYARGSAAIALLILFGSTAMVAAEIDSNSVATGSHGSESVRSGPAPQSIPVGEAKPRMTISITGPSHDDLDGNGGVSAGDTLTFEYTVSNVGDITLTDVAIESPAPSFDGSPGENRMSAATAQDGANRLAPGQSARFSGTYPLSPLDVYRSAGREGGVVAVARAVAIRPDNGETVATADSQPVRFTVIAQPALRIDNSYEITTDNGTPGAADAGDVITYRYAVTNTGNVPIEGIRVSDTHEGQAIAEGLILEQAPPLESDGPLGNSRDATTGDGVWDLLGPGATVRFEYVHTVTQAGEQSRGTAPLRVSIHCDHRSGVCSADRPC
jgi:hypothetical protein